VIGQFSRLLPYGAPKWTAVLVAKLFHDLL